MYGIREIARDRNNVVKMNRTAVEILLLHMLLTVLGYIAVAILCLTVPQVKADIHLFWVLSLTIFFTTIAVEWFYQGIEQYDYITTRTLIMRLLAMVFIFLAIHSPKDYLAYGISCLIMETGASICNFWNLRKYILLTKINGYHIKAHLNQLLYSFFLVLQ